MPLPTTITCAGSCPEPEPCTIDTLSSRGASARMIRLYSGHVAATCPGFASSMPLSISGTNCCGSLTNFFTSHSFALWCPAALPGRQARSSSDSRHALLTASNSTATPMAPASTESRLRSPV